MSRLWCGVSGGGALETSAARRAKRAGGVMVWPAARAESRERRISSARGARAGEGVGVGTREVSCG